MIKTLVVDDEPLALDLMQALLAEHDDVEVLGAYRSGGQALQAIGELQPDLIFLDIQMPGMSGFELIAHIAAEQMPTVVFATAFDSFAVEAFNVHAIDYLLKPIDPKRLAESLNRVRARSSTSVSDGADSGREKGELLDALHGIGGVSAPASVPTAGQLADDSAGNRTNRLAIRDGADVRLIPYEDIDWIDAAGDYMCVHAEGQTHIMRCTMNELQQRLSHGSFARIHRSTVVNLSKIVKVKSLPRGESELLLTTGARLKVSRTFKSEINALKRF